MTDKESAAFTSAEGNVDRVMHDIIELLKEHKIKGLDDIGLYVVVVGKSGYFTVTSNAGPNTNHIQTLKAILDSSSPVFPKLN